VDSHKLELSLQIDHFDVKGELKNTYIYPYNDTSEDTVVFSVKNQDNQISLQKIKPSRSFVLNFLELFSAAWTGSSENFTDVLGNPYSVNTSFDMLNINASSSVVSSGIWLGTGALSSTITSYAMTGQIQHGSGSGQLMYGNTTIVSPAAITGGQRLIVKRDFVNSSSGSVSISASGITVKSNGGSFQYLSMLDITDETLTPINLSIVTGQTLTVEYHFDITTLGDYTNNFLKVLQSCYGSGSVNIQTSTYDTVGSQSINYAHFNSLRIDAGANIPYWGIVVGSSSVAKNINDYRLYGQIQHGSGSNQLMYGAGQGDSIVITGSSAQFSAKRSFVNSSLAQITVAEAGIYLNGVDTVVNTQDNKKTGVVRSIFAAFNVGVGESFQLKYNKKITN